MKSFPFSVLRAVLLAQAIAFIPVPFASGQVIEGPTNQVVANGGTAVFSVSVSGTGPFTYQWQFNGTNINIITTVAGNGTAGYSGDGGAAINAELSFYNGNDDSDVVMDQFGNLFIADSEEGRIRKVDTNGIITTVAGNGTEGYAGDNGAATSAELNVPQGLVVAKCGNIFIADYFNQRVREINTNGIITTVAGNGTSGYSGDGGVATNAELDYPAAVALDSNGNLYIADEFNMRIREVNTNGIITTIVGNGTAGYLGDGGAAINAELDYPESIAIDCHDNLFIADTESSRIRMMATNGVIITVAGGGSGGLGDGGEATNATLLYPMGIAVDGAGNLFVSDSSHNRIREVSTNGIITTCAGTGVEGYSGDGGFPDNATMGLPAGIVADNADDLVFSDIDNQRVREITSCMSPTLTLKNVSTNDIGNYSVIITYPGGSITSSVAMIYMPPYIISQPQNVDTLAGSSATFVVGAAGPGPIGYQWTFDGANIVGATNAAYTISNAVPGNTGLYSVMVTNLYGGITSSNAILTVPPLLIIAQPQNVATLAGGSATFVVGTSGAGPFNYQWAFDGTNILGATSASFTVSDVSNSNLGFYSVTVTNAYGSVTSSNAALVIAYITQEPTNQLGTIGGIANFTVSLSASEPFTYQWQFNGTNINSIITTVAGNGTSGYSGDGGEATNAELHDPSAVVADNLGNLFISDAFNQRIRKVGANGIITTVAGNGTNGYSGDGGKAANAELNYPGDVAVDVFGNLYIADTDNQRIRKVATNSIITTIAGNGILNYSGDGGKAINAGLNYPNGVAVDGFGNLYIADTDNQRIRKVGTNGIIVTMAGNGYEGYSGDGGVATNEELYDPSAVALDGFGNVFIADTENNRVRETGTNGIITTGAGNGTRGYSSDGIVANNTELNYPYGVAVDIYGNMFIADTYNQRIREIGANGIIATVAGGGYFGNGIAATNAELEYPNGVAVDGYGNLFIADTENQQIRKVNLVTLPTLTLNGISTNSVGNYSVIISYAGGSITSSVATLNISPAIVSQPQNIIALGGGSATFTVTATGPALNYQWAFDGANIPGATNTSYPIGSVSSNNIGLYSVTVTNSFASVTSSNATLSLAYITQQPTNQVVAGGATAALNVSLSTNGPFTFQWRLNGTNLISTITTIAGNGGEGYSGDGISATNAELNLPSTVVLDSSGNLYIADTDNQRIRRVDTNGIITTFAGNGRSGSFVGSIPATNASLDYPSGMAVNGFGLLIADTDYQLIVNVLLTNEAGGGTNGDIYYNAGDGEAGYSGDGGYSFNAELDFPEGVALDNFFDTYIVDTGNSRIRDENTNFIIRTVAGNGTSGYSGDGGMATNAELNTPHGVAVDNYGNLFIADTGNQRIREMGTNGVIRTVAGNGTAGYSGDGGLATNAALNLPSSVAVDNYGNLFIADTDNQRIREVGINGTITTIAGNGFAGFSGNGGAATNSELNLLSGGELQHLPSGIALDGNGNLLVADSNNQRVRKITSVTSPILVLNNISTANIGNYSVVISYSGGSVTSSIVNLSVVPLFITSQPQNASAILSSNATFSITASGQNPLAYEWFFDSTNQVAGSTNLLTISDVQPTNAGNYSAVITNIYGSVTSSEAQLTVSLPSIVPSFIQSNGSSALEISWGILPGLTYQVQYTTNLLGGNWINLGSPITTTNSAGSILDSINTNPQSFYRVLLIQ